MKLCKAWLSVAVHDCVGDLVEPSGSVWHEDFGAAEAPMVLWAHDGRGHYPIGRFVSIERRQHPSGAAGLWGGFIVDHTELEAQLSLKLISVSVGFYIKDASIITTPDGFEALHVTSWVLDECSLVSRPCCPLAHIVEATVIEPADALKLINKTSTDKAIDRASILLRQLNKELNGHAM